MKDWVIRSIKTFVEAFLGVLIPVVVLVLNNIVDYDLHKIWVVLFPAICAGLAAGITAVWNLYLEHREET